jgi:hypothetical protein
MPAAAPVTACSSCRLPITFPQGRANASCGASKEPRAASSAASFAREWECRPADRDSAASAGRYQARKVLAALRGRMAEVGLELHPDKTRIVYCKDSNRRGSAEHTSFTFLGFTFQPRQARRKDGVRFTSFLPAISKDALKKISAAVGHEQVPQPEHLEESHQGTDGGRRPAAAVLRALGLGETGRQMTRTTGAV